MLPKISVQIVTEFAAVFSELATCKVALFRELNGYVMAWCCFMAKCPGKGRAEIYSQRWGRG